MNDIIQVIGGLLILIMIGLFIILVWVDYQPVIELVRKLIFTNTLAIFTIWLLDRATRK